MKYLEIGVLHHTGSQVFYIYISYKYLVAKILHNSQLIVNSVM